MDVDNLYNTYLKPEDPFDWIILTFITLISIGTMAMLWLMFASGYV